MINSKELEELPPLLKHLILNLLDKNQNVFNRKIYKDRLVDIIKVLNRYIETFDKETAKANFKPVAKV